MVYLRRTVAQPHRVNVTRDDVGVRPAVFDGKIHRGIERVRKAIAEHPGKFAIADGGLDALNDRFNRGTFEFPFCFGHADDRKSAFRPAQVWRKHRRGGEQGGVLQETSPGGLIRHGWVGVLRLGLRSTKAFPSGVGAGWAPGAKSVANAKLATGNGDGAQYSLRMAGTT